MKIHRIELTGFGPFREHQVVDFDQFNDDGIFLITGRTGSGKTSILDGIVYALFNKVPRFEKSSGSVRSDHCEIGEPTTVQLDFSTSAGRYRITRSPEYVRPKVHGEGTTKQVATVEFATIAADDSETVVSTKEKEVGAHVIATVGMNGDQFLQVIMLAQGRFQEFLVASSETRQDLLRTIFDTRRFGDVEKEFEARSKALRDRLAATRTATLSSINHVAQVVGLDATVERPAAEWVEPEDIGPWLTALLAELTQTQDHVDHEAHVATAKLAQATEVLHEVKSTAEAQAERAQAVSTLGKLEALAEQIDDDRARIAAGRRAAVVWSRLQDSAARAAALADADVALQAAVDSFSSTGQPLPADVDGAVSELDGQLGTLRQLAELEAGVPRLHDEHVAAQAELVAFDEHVASARVRRTELEELIADRTAQRGEGLAHVAGRGTADQQVRDLLTLRDVSAQRDQVRVQAQTALDAARQADQVLSRALNHAAALRAARLDGFAATLALDLVANQPCPVCGATEHPEPARHQGDEVTPADIARAEKAAHDAQSEVTATQSALTSLETKRAGLDQTLGGKSANDIAAELEAARQLVATFDSAEKQNAAWADEITEAKTALEPITQHLMSAETDRATLVGRASACAADLKSAQERLAQGRGDFDTVSAHLTSIEARRGRLHAVAVARAHREAADQAVQSAQQAMTDALVENDFTDARAAEDARIEPRTLDEITERVAAHEKGLAVALSRLADPRLAGAPDEPVDMVPAEQARSAAEGAAETAVNRAAEARKQLQIVTAAAQTAREHATAWSACIEEGGAVLGLAQTIRGQDANTKRMSLEKFVLAAELEEIMVAANEQLKMMSGKQYRLEHSDALASHGAQSGLDLVVFDPDTGTTRSPKSLSGGEKFLASLALALGLAEVVSARAGGLHLDTLFIDEGFGSLDPETLEAAMSTLDSLRTHGRTIGLISHVEVMKERIDAQLKVTVTAAGTSRIT